MPETGNLLLQSVDIEASLVAERLEIDCRMYRDDDLCKKLAFFKAVVVETSEGTNERAIITQARKHAIESNAVENFKILRGR